jgi:predicted N-acetyltransferase YhbS
MLTGSKWYLPVMKDNKLSELNIRQACRADQTAIQEVTLVAYQEYAAYISPQQWQEYRGNILDTLHEALPEMQLVAETNGEIVGSVLMVPAEPIMESPDNGHIQAGFPEVRLLAVTPAARGQGIGKALMLACIAQARRAGESVLTLHSNDLMQIAIRIYERLGFQRDPEMDFRPAENAVIKGYRLDMT